MTQELTAKEEKKAEQITKKILKIKGNANSGITPVGAGHGVKGKSYKDLSKDLSVDSRELIAGTPSPYIEEFLPRHQQTDRMGLNAGELAF